MRIPAIVSMLSVVLLALAFPTASSGATFVVTKTTDDDGPCTVDDCALREAILAANAAPGIDTVELAPGTYALTLTGPGENLGLSGDLDIRDDLEISGDPIDPPTIVGDGQDRVMQIHFSTVELSALTLTGGAGNASGGGIFGRGSDLTLLEVTLTGSSAGAGGGLRLIDSSAALAGCSVHGNEASSEGGGVAVSASSPDHRLEIINSTISGNASAGSGGGLALNFVFGTGVVRVVNSTIAYNTALTASGILSDLTDELSFDNTLIVGNDCSGATQVSFSNGGNLESPGSTCFPPGGGDQTGVAEPGLGELADNGGPTWSHALLPGSPAIDAAVDADCPPVDQRGFPRPIDGDLDGLAQCDIGAVEIDGGPIPAAIEIPTLGPLPMAVLAVGLVLLALTRCRRR